MRLKEGETIAIKLDFNGEDLRFEPTVCCRQCPLLTTTVSFRSEDDALDRPKILTSGRKTLKEGEKL